MIPTRLGQQFNTGTVLGFNSRSGSIMIFSNTLTRVDWHEYKDQEQVYANALALYPVGYMCPSKEDFLALTNVDDFVTDVFLDVKYLHHITAHLTNCKLLGQHQKYPSFLLTRPDASINKYDCFIHFYVFEDNRKLFAEFYEYKSSKDYGTLIPVLKINGENCDSY